MIIIWLFSLGFTLGVAFSLLQPQRAIPHLVRFTLGGILIGLVLGTFRVIPPGDIGIVSIFGEIQPQIIRPGLHVLNPMSSVEKFALGPHEIQLGMDYIDKTTNRKYYIPIRTTYEVTEFNLPQIYQERGKLPTRDEIGRTIYEIAEQSMNQYALEELKEKLSWIERLIANKCNEVLKPQGIFVQTVALDLTIGVKA